MDDRTRIERWFNENNLSSSKRQINSYIQYIELIRETSAKMNLVSKGDLPQIIERHLLDSLHALTVYDFPMGANVADLGSGAGFPGIPIAIARPDLKMTLIESRRRKCLFLNNAIEKIGLQNTVVIHDRWENIDSTFDIIMVRAVFREEDIMKKVRACLGPTGVLLYFDKYNKIKIL